jgi:hypothetical protein
VELVEHCVDLGTSALENTVERSRQDGVATTHAHGDLEREGKPLLT